LGDVYAELAAGGAGTCAEGIMLFVTFHGGKPERNPHKNNVHAYDKDGKMIATSVLEQPDGITLDELRGICFVGGLLYVVNANKTQNSVLCYTGADTNYKFCGKLISHAECPAILHPFDLAFDGAGYCYVSSQDTNVVTRLKISEGGKSATPAAIAPALPANGKFLPGTYVASSVSVKPATTPVPAPAGLEYSDDGAKKHSIRGIVWAGGALYVADQPARHIKVYDKNGKLLGQSNGIESPVHLMVWKGSLYVSGGDAVYSGKLPNPPGNFTLAETKLKVKNSSGMAFTDKGHLYIASRTERFINKFDSDFKQVKFDCDNLPDDPEFLLHV
jgi:hypothetical protein